MLKLTAGSSRYFEATFNPDEIKKKLDSDADREKMEGMKRIMAVCAIINIIGAVICDNRPLWNAYQNISFFQFFTYLIELISHHCLTSICSNDIKKYH